jgi:hypothetical protein
MWSWQWKFLSKWKLSCTGARNCSIIFLLDCCYDEHGGQGSLLAAALTVARAICCWHRVAGLGAEYRLESNRTAETIRNSPPPVGVSFDQRATQSASFYPI